MTTTASATNLPNPPPGLIISVTEHIRHFLSSASQDANLSRQLRNQASDLSLLANSPYKSLREIWTASRPETRPSWAHLLSGSHFVFTSPKPREKSDELKVRLRKLSEMAEKKAYEELVKDITPKKDTNEPFSSYKDQLGFGLHVVLTMFTGYLLGYASFRALFGHSPVMNAAGGILGLAKKVLVPEGVHMTPYMQLDRELGGLSLHDFCGGMYEIGSLAVGSVFASQV